MTNQNRLVLLLLIFNFICGPYLFGYGTVFIKKYEDCGQPGKSIAKLNATFKTVGDKQYVDATWVLTAPLDNHVKSNISLEMLLGSEYVYLFSLNEKKSCEALHKYYGEFWYDLERNAQMIPGLCPIAMGRYQLHNCLLDWEKMTTLQNFPFGDLRITCKSYDRSGSLFICIVAEVEYRFS